MVIVFILLAFLGVVYGVGGLIANLVSRKNYEDYQAQQNRRGNPPQVFDFPATKITAIASAVVLFCFILFSVFIVKIDGQSVGVVITPTGVSQTPVHTGWRIIMPWWDVHPMDKTVWVYTCAKGTSEGNKKNEDAIWAPTSEGIKMGFDISASWKIDANQAPWIYQNVTPQDGNDESRYLWLEEQVIRTKLKSCLALVVSEYTPIQVYSSKRQEIQDKVLKKMKVELASWRVILDQVDVREVYYDPDYEAEIKNKKVQEQKALTLIEVTKQIQEQYTQSKLQKEIVIQTAEGDAQALKIKGDAIRQNPGVIQLNWIEKWDGQLPTYMMGGNANMTMMMPIK